jgi:thiol-disulfide isomerase/thioredoxin
MKTRQTSHGLRLALALCLTFTMAPSDMLAQEPPPGFSMHPEPRSLPEIRFENGEGEAMSLADFKGSLVLLNIWATWCAPCRREMPTLDRLQATLAGADFQVVALSLDRNGLPVVQEFYAELGLETLPIYVDESGAAQRALNVLGLPTTLLLDRDGNEVGRLLGPAEWDSPQMVGFFREYLKRSAADEAREWSPLAQVDRSSPSQARKPSLQATGEHHLAPIIRRLNDEFTGNGRRDQAFAHAGLAQRPALLAAWPQWRDRGDHARGRDRNRAQLELARGRRHRPASSGRAAVRRDVRPWPVHEQDDGRFVLGLLG